MSYYMEKPKRKSDNFEGPLDSLFTFLGAKPIPFETTASVSLEVCADRLSAMEERPGWLGYLFNRRVITVDINRMDDSTYQFRVRKKQGKRLPVLVTGNMERLSDSSTLITGEARSQHLFWQMVIPFLVFILFFLIFGLIQNIPAPFNLLLTIVMTVTLAISAVMTSYDRSAFTDLIEDKLTRADFTGTQKRKSY